MTADQFVQALSGEVPTASLVIEEHLADNEGELLIHLLMADLLRFCVAAFTADETGSSRRCLDVVGSAFETGDEHLRNAVEVSFLEHAWDEHPRFLATWPDSLLQEWRRQHATS
jgi:hypothetical protein